jgi:hypothetical protein
MHCNIPIATPIEQQIIAHPLSMSYLLLFFVISCMVQKYFEQKVAILLDISEMNWSLRVETHSSSISVAVYPIKFNEKSVFPRQ